MNGRKRAKALYTALLLCMATTGLTACGSDNSSDSASSGGMVMGRVTSVSSNEIQMEVMTDQGGKGGPQGSVSGAAVSGSAMGEAPDGQMKQGERAPDGETKQGERPSGAPDGEMKQGERPSGAPDGEKKRGESKTYTIDSDTKIYQQNGDEKTEITLDDLNPGSMVSIETDSDGDEAESITIQNSQGGNAGDSGTAQ